MGMNEKDNNDIFQLITSYEAKLVLHRFINKHDEHVEEIREIALELISDVDPDEISSDVKNALECLQVEDLWDRSGKTRYGYVEPSEESWEMFEEALSPYIDSMKKYQEAGLNRLAKTYCIGIIQGIKDYDSNSLSEFKDWAEDAPYEYIDRVFQEWKENAQDEDIAEVQSKIE
jgi:hypothetical protein